MQPVPFNVLKMYDVQGRVNITVIFGFNLKAIYQNKKKAITYFRYVANY